MRKTRAMYDTLLCVQLYGSGSQSSMIRRMDVFSNDGREHRRQMLERLEREGYVVSLWDGSRKNWFLTSEGGSVLEDLAMRYDVEV